MGWEYRVDGSGHKEWGPSPEKQQLETPSQRKTKRQIALATASTASILYLLHPLSSPGLSPTTTVFVLDSHRVKLGFLVAARLSYPLSGRPSPSSPIDCRPAFPLRRPPPPFFLHPPLTISRPANFRRHSSIPATSTSDLPTPRKSPRHRPNKQTSVHVADDHGIDSITCVLIDTILVPFIPPSPHSRLPAAFRSSWPQPGA